MTRASWFTSEKAKNLASLLSAVASIAAILITLFKPAAENKAADAYAIIHDEMVEQRNDMRDIHKGLSDLGAWIAVIRDRENERRRMMLGFSIDEDLIQKKKPDPNEPNLPLPKLPANDDTLPPVPTIPPLSPRAPLPKKEQLF